MNDLVDDGFHEIQLSGKQLVFLFMATTLVAVVIFLCGVRVGRGVKGDGTADQSDGSDPSGLSARTGLAARSGLAARTGLTGLADHSGAASISP